MRVIFLLGLLLLSTMPPLISETIAASSQIIYTVPIRHRQAESVAASVAPLVEDGGHLSVSGNKLIIRTSRENFEQLSLLIDELDKPVKQLLISVKTQSRGQQQEGGLHTYGNITRGTIGADGKPVDKDDRHISVTHSTGWGSGESNYQLRAEEGQRVMIQTGQQIPIQSRYGVVGGVVQSESYQPVMSGIGVTARLQGNRVVLQIDQQDNNLNGRNIDTQLMSTQVSGQLGQWIQIGGISQQGSSNERGIVQRHKTHNQNDKQIFVKVDVF